jgi:hypothetical protein
MTIELQERTDHKGELTYWIMVNGSAEIPIYRDRQEAIENYNKYILFYKNPPKPVILASETI